MVFVTLEIIKIRFREGLVYFDLPWVTFSFLGSIVYAEELLVPKANLKHTRNHFINKN